MAVLIPPLTPLRMPTTRVHAMLLKEWQRGELSEYNLLPSSELEFKQGLSWG